MGSAPPKLGSFAATVLCRCRETTDDAWSELDDKKRRPGISVVSRMSLLGSLP